HKDTKRADRRPRPYCRLQLRHSRARPQSMDEAAITSEPPSAVDSLRKEPFGGPSNRGAILSIPVTVQVVLGSTSLPVSGLMKLARGALVSLHPRVGAR